MREINTNECAEAEKLLEARDKKAPGTFTGDLGVKIYQIFGEFETGTTFRKKFANDSIEFGRSNVANKKGGCFIVTAAYGNADHAVVNDFRAFRDEILQRSLLGRKFIDWYYKNAPRLARVIRQNQRLQALARLFLFTLSKITNSIRMLFKS